MQERKNHKIYINEEDLTKAKQFSSLSSLVLERTWENGSKSPPNKTRYPPNIFIKNVQWLEITVISKNESKMQARESKRVRA